MLTPVNTPLLSFRLDIRWLPLLVAAVAAYIACCFTDRMPIEWGYENSLIENIQMAVLAAAGVFCATARNHRGFYRFAVFVVLLLMLREVSFGRTIFFPVEGQVDTFYKWKEIPYGWLAHWIIGAYMAGMGLVFLFKGHWKSLWDIVRRKAYPFWGILVMLIGLVLTSLNERTFHDCVAEEISELGMYLAFLYLVAVYTRLPESKGE